jgi:ABC-2 type transport system permease protein
VSKFITCILVEFKKFFHSKVPFISMLALLIVPFMGGLFMFILKDPVLAQKLGVISAKAQITGTADWPTFLGLLAQAVSIGGFLVFGIVTSWIFGREYSDRTIKDLLALPISRNVIVFSKFIVVFLWCLLLALLVFAIGLIVGNVVDIPGWSYELTMQGFSIFFICALLTIFLSTPVAIFASIGRGYLSPLSFMIFTIVLAQIIAATGYGQLFPWSIPALASGAAGSENSVLENYSIVIVLLTSLVGLIGTTLWWRYADQN